MSSIAVTVKAIEFSYQINLSPSSQFFPPRILLLPLLSAHLRVKGIFAPSIVWVLQLWPLTPPLLVACSVADLRIAPPCFCGNFKITVEARENNGKSKSATPGKHSNKETKYWRILWETTGCQLHIRIKQN